MHISLKAHFNLLDLLIWDFFRGLHFSYHFIKHFDLIESNFDAIWQRLRWLVRLFEPRVRLHLF